MIRPSQYSVLKSQVNMQDSKSSGKFGSSSSVSTEAVVVIEAPRVSSSSVQISDHFWFPGRQVLRGRTVSQVKKLENDKKEAKMTGFDYWFQHVLDPQQCMQCTLADSNSSLFKTPYFVFADIIYEAMSGSLDVQGPWKTYQGTKVHSIGILVVHNGADNMEHHVFDASNALHMDILAHWLDHAVTIVVWNAVQFYSLLRHSTAGTIGVESNMYLEKWHRTSQVRANTIGLEEPKELFRSAQNPDEMKSRRKVPGIVLDPENLTTPSLNPDEWNEVYKQPAQFCEWEGGPIVPDLPSVASLSLSSSSALGDSDGVSTRSTLGSYLAAHLESNQSSSISSSTLVSSTNEPVMLKQKTLSDLVRPVPYKPPSHFFSDQRMVLWRAKTCCVKSECSIREHDVLLFVGKLKSDPVWTAASSFQARRNCFEIAHVKTKCEPKDWKIRSNLSELDVRLASLADITGLLCCANKTWSCDGVTKKPPVSTSQKWFQVNPRGKQAASNSLLAFFSKSSNAN